MSSQPSLLPDADQPADHTQAGTPQYGDFGTPADVQQPDQAEQPPRRVYVGGYLAPSGEHGDDVNLDADATQQPSHSVQNQDTEAVIAAQDKDEDVERTAFSLDDPRYAGGDKFNPENEQKGL